MIPSHVPVLVVGATMAGLGIATAAKDRVLLVERSALVGHEFVAGCRPGEDWSEPPQSAPAHELRAELARRGLLSEEGQVHLPAIAPVLCHWIRREGLNVQMMTEVIEVAGGPGGYEVTLFDASGWRKLRADHLIDTTPSCVSAPAYRAPELSRSINAILHVQPPVPEKLPEAAGDGVQLARGLFPGELILRLPLAPEDGWPDARGKLHRYWQRHAEAFAPWTLAAAGDALDIRTARREERLDDGRLWFPSSGYANLLQAFDAGCRKGAELYEAVLSSQ